MPRILVFGASCTYGFGDTKGGWVQRLRTYLDEAEFAGKGDHHGVFDLGIGGDKSGDVLKRIESDAAPRSQQKNVITLISVGMNDSAVEKENGTNLTEIKKYRKNMIQIVEKAKSFSKEVILVGLTPVNQKLVDPIPWAWDGKVSYFNTEIEKYNKVMMEVADKAGLIFVELFNELGGESGFSPKLRDGAHPNDEGHEMIYQIVKNELKAKGII